MGSWARLELGPGGRVAADKGTARWFAAKNYIPSLWPALFAPDDLRTVPAEAGGDEVGSEASTSESFRCSTSIVMARRAVATFLEHSASDPWLRVAWEGLAPLQDLLRQLPANWRCELDPDDLIGAAGAEALHETVVRATKLFAPLSDRFDPVQARSYCSSADPHICRGELDRDGRRARRWFRARNDREAFFVLFFGRAGDDTTRHELQPWLEDGQSRLPLVPVETEARLLLKELMDRGVLRDASEEWALRYFDTAVRARSASTLCEVLEAMVAQGVATVPAPRGLSVLSKPLERIIGPDAPRRVPVFNQNELAAALEVLGD